MRMSAWTPDIVRFMEDASLRTTYFSAVAREVCHGLAPGSRICDAGCGMGQISFELAGLGMDVTAVDTSADALRRASRRGRGHRGLRPAFFHQDYTAHAAEASPYDRMVFCLSASVEKAFSTACSNGAASLVVVNKAHAREEADCFSIGSMGSVRPAALARPVVYEVDKCLDDLGAKGIVCTAHEEVFEFGQPLRSLEDAALYFSLFRTRRYPSGIGKAELRTVLERRDDAEFPYYLPVERRLVFFEVDLEASLRGGFSPHTATDAASMRSTAQGALFGMREKGFVAAKGA